MLYLEIISFNLLLVFVVAYLMLFGFVKLADDTRHITFREYSKIYLSIATMYLGWYFIYIFRVMATVSPEEHLWFPYIFGGMPAYSIAIGVNWWNHISQIINFIVNVFMNVIQIEIFTILFLSIGLLLWLKYKKIWMPVVAFYLMLIFMRVY